MPISPNMLIHSSYVNRLGFSDSGSPINKAIPPHESEGPNQVEVGPVNLGSINER